MSHVSFSQLWAKTGTENLSSKQLGTISRLPWVMKTPGMDSDMMRGVDVIERKALCRDNPKDNTHERNPTDYPPVYAECRTFLEQCPTPAHYRTPT
jgi:hypothetical protein